MKYQDLQKELTGLIHSGNGLSENGQFLSEREISEKYDVSRTTVRRAILELCKQGYLYRSHGKGTFLKTSQPAYSIYSITTCSENYSEMGLHPSRKLLRHEVRSAPRTVAAHLKIKQNEPVLFLDILYLADRTIFNETISYLPLSRFPGLRTADFSKEPLLDILRERYNAVPDQTQNSIQAIMPPAEISKNLNITPALPIIMFESVTSGYVGEHYCPFEYFQCFYRTDILRFHYTQDHRSTYG